MAHALLRLTGHRHLTIRDIAAVRRIAGEPFSEDRTTGDLEGRA
jgi:hypothetical protein